MILTGAVEAEGSNLITKVFGVWNNESLRIDAERREGCQGCPRPLPRTS